MGTAPAAVTPSGEASRHRRWRLALAGDRGDASIEMTIVFPTVILLTVAIVQACLWYHAKDIALSAARTGVAAGRGSQSQPQTGVTKANEFLAQAAGSSLLDGGARLGTTTADRITVRVTGRVPSLIPGWTITIDQSASGPREHWRTK